MENTKTTISSEIESNKQYQKDKTLSQVAPWKEF